VIYLPYINLQPAQPTVTEQPTAQPVETKSVLRNEHTEVARVERVHVSHYTPWDGGSSCSKFVNGQCISHMASGKDWRDWIDKAAACPGSWKFGTIFRLPDGRVFECQDRGSAIRYGYTPYWMTYDGLAWVDLLTAAPVYKFGEVVSIEVLR
jgi:hypothetical protein